MKPVDMELRDRLHEKADFGMSLQDLKEAEEARQEHGLRLLDTIGFVHAASLAINVRGDRRAAFNIEQGRSFGARLRENACAAELKDEYDNAPEPSP